jgi:hypothetical protein
MPNPESGLPACRFGAKKGKQTNDERVGRGFISAMFSGAACAQINAGEQKPNRTFPSR